MTAQVATVTVLAFEDFEESHIWYRFNRWERADGKWTHPIEKRELAKVVNEYLGELKAQTMSYDDGISAIIAFMSALDIPSEICGYRITKAWAKRFGREIEDMF